MNILSIDTSTMRGSVALTRDFEIVDVIRQDTESSHSEWLFENIKLILSRNKWTFGDLEGLVVAKGPGSFTGLRIGIAAAKGIAIGLNLPLYGISSLEALAYNILNYKGIVVSIIDAKRDEVYFSANRICNYKLENVLPESVLAPACLVERLEMMDGDMLLIGDGVAKYEELFRNAKKNFGIDPNQLYSNASGMAVATARLIKEGLRSSLLDLSANYIRHSDAQIG